MLIEAKEARERLLDVLSMHSDRILECMVEDKEIPYNLIHDTVKRLTCERVCVPVLMGSAYKNIGVQPLLDAMVKYLPSPEIQDDTLKAFVFKLTEDTHGQLSYIRMFSGSLYKGDKVYIPRLRKEVRIGKLVS